MKILIVGSGAREHAIGEKISQSPLCDKIYFAPGNGGTGLIGENADIKVTDLDGLVAFAEKNKIDFTIVGPEDPLNLGLVDVFEDRGLKIFGPRKEAAKLEGSKAFAKDFMVRHKIATGQYIETSNLDQAIDFTKKLLEESSKAVIKADGLCAGKGVFIVDNIEEGEEYLRKILKSGDYGIKKVIIEEFLEGFEMSLIAFVDNHTIKMLPSSKDHKNIFDKDQGLNTGGMGTYSPNTQASPYLTDLEDQILNPFLKGIQADKMDFRGVIFIGLMITADGIKVLEFNTRFGDPETQSILNRLDSDLLDLMIKTSDNKLDQADLVFNDKKVLTLILASEGYPESYEKGFEISGLDKLKGVKVYHAGTKLEGEKLLTAGGRVLSIVAIEDSFEEAINKAYQAAEVIDFSGKYYRTDIGPQVQRFYIEEDLADFNQIADLLDKNHIDKTKVKVFTRYDYESLNEEEGLDFSKKLAGSKKCFYNSAAFDLQKTFDKVLVVAMEKPADIKDLDLEKSLVLAISKEVKNFDCTCLKKDLLTILRGLEGKVLGVPTKIS